MTPASAGAGRAARPPAPDQRVRDGIVERLGDTLFVEAGAGSGKTSCLVDRFVALVQDGVPADAIAAITFTEQAAAELADRIRGALQERAPGCERARAALDVLDRAAICTLHSFAQRILVAHPVEAGIPPRVEVLDEIASEIAFSRRWEAFVDRVLDDPALERPIRLLAACGRVVEQLRDLALAFGDNWDLVEQRIGEVHDVPALDVSAWCAEAEALAADVDRLCTAADDRLLERAREVRDHVAALRAAPDDDAVLELLTTGRPNLASRVGRKENYPAGVIDSLRARFVELGERRSAMAAEVTRACLYRLADEVARFTVERAEQRRREGRLEFHDLLVLARDVLRDGRVGWAVRSSLRERYQRLLVDEFQDTDPIQVEIAVLLGSPDPDAGAKPWQKVEVDPGRLFFVGDPKQSIYRFRRADIGVFLSARDAFVRDASRLTANFRTTRSIVEWVNRVFAQVIIEDRESQPEYVPLDAVREAPTVGPAVAFVGVEPHGDKPSAAELREREAESVAAAILRAVGEGWEVEDRATGAWRPASWSDVCILLPARTSLPALERALEAHDIPYRAETSSLVYATREVRDLFAVARAIEDPTDSLSVATALRSPAFGCGDDDLYSWRSLGGRWDHQRPFPEGAPAEHPVALGLAWLREVHRERAWLSASQVLDRIVRERRLMEIGFATRRPRDVVRRLRFVVDQARAWQEAGGGSLRDYLTWVELQSMESARVVETVLPETDDEAVRIMTVHGAKGLEFPITVLSGMTTQMQGRRGGVQVTFPRDASGWAIKLGANVVTPEFEENQPRDEQMDEDERRRLLYVAATRARDHLVVSVHRKVPNGSGSKPARPTSAELFWTHGDHPDLVTHLEPAGFGVNNERIPVGIDSKTRMERLSREEWRAERARADRLGRVPVSVSATRIAEERARLAAGEDAGLAKEPRDLDLPAWQKGRYGTAIGRAVHAVLQTVDLTTGESLTGRVAAQAAAEGVLGHEATIEALCRSALESAVVAEAAGARHWREVYVGAPVDGIVLEGYVDLLYRRADGLVIVDHKTDSWRSLSELDTKVERYRPQLAAYAEAIARVTGEAVADAVLLFLHPGGAVARSVGDLTFEGLPGFWSQ